MVRQLLEAMHKQGLFTLGSFSANTVAATKTAKRCETFDSHVRYGNVREAETALSFINYVHGNGDLPTTYVQYNYADVDAITLNLAKGVFRPSESTIYVKKNYAPSPLAIVETTLHELGHSIDFGLGNIIPNTMENVKDGRVTYSMFGLYEWETSTKYSKPLTMLRDAIVKTQRYREYHELYKAVTTVSEKEALSYYLAPKELFARSYSQYILTKCHKAYKKGIAFNDNTDLDRVYRDHCLGKTSQWTETDFKPIEEAFDYFFKAKGWLHADI